MGMKLYHKGKGDIHGETHVDRDEAGAYLKDAKGNDIKGTPFVFKPGTAIEFDDKTGARLKRLYANKLVSMDDVQRQFEASTAPQAGTAPAIHKDPEAEARAEEERQKAVENLVAERTFKALLAAGMTEAEAHAAAWPDKADEKTNPEAEKKSEGGMLGRLGLGKAKG